MANDAESIRGEWIAIVSSDMSDRTNDAVSIQLSRKLSEKKDGKTPEARWWATVFFMICGFAVFIDPLFCYIYVIDRDKMRISSDPKAVWAYFGLRTAIDVFYFIDIIVFLCGRDSREGKEFEAESKLKEKCYLLRRILVALPIPEVLVVCAPFINNSDPFYAIFVIVPFQYTLRIYLIYGWERWRHINETTRRWLKPLLDLLPFILASHLFGALWYRLAVQRQIDCWKPHCKDIRGDNCTRIKDFSPSRQIPKAINITHLQALCPTNSEDKNVFDFGIYLYALQPNSTCSSNLLQRISQSFWWALRNLSSFGSNLQTSMHTLEIYFSIVISISGIALFVVCISARIKVGEGSISLCMKCIYVVNFQACPYKIFFQSSVYIFF